MTHISLFAAMNSFKNDYNDEFSGYGLEVGETTAQTLQEIDDFFLDNDIASYFLGVCQDFKHFGFAVSVIILSRDGTKIVRLLRKEACYCRFAPADKDGRITRLLYANWRKCIASRDEIEVIEMLDPASPWRDLQDRLAKPLHSQHSTLNSTL